LDEALAKARGALEFDAYQRAYGGHTRAGANHEVTLVPLRHGTRAVGLLAAASPALDIGTLDAVAGVVAIAIERTQFLEERDAAELVRQKADLAATLLAALSHDLKTPLTAIRVAVENLRGDLPGEERKARPAPQRQSSIASRASSRTFWTWHGSMPQPSGRSAVGGRGRCRGCRDGSRQAHASGAESASGRRCRPRGGNRSTAGVGGAVAPARECGAVLTVRSRDRRPRPRRTRWAACVGDRSWPGLDPGELDHLFERFYRGRAARRASFGTGMGLSITRGLLAAAGGRVWAENVPEAGARFTLVVPGAVRPVTVAQ
jgi:two-component system sensor histidine kinase KdpD